MFVHLACSTVDINTTLFGLRRLSLCFLQTVVFLFLNYRRDSNNQTERVLKEKDETIRDLMAEGEKLSKQQLQNSNIIKKLRTKEKDNETLIKTQKYAPA